MDIFTVENLIALLTLTSLEIVLGIDNIVFIAIIAARLGPERRDAARVTGLAIAIISRLLLLLTLSFLASLTAPLVSVGSLSFSGRDLILLAGGVFLIYKATKEIHEKTTGSESELESGKGSQAVSFGGVISQIVMIDIIFSLDSVITAVGMTDNLPIMALAVVLAVLVMLVFSGGIVRFIEDNPTVKMLALAFLLMIGFVLVLDGMGHHIEKGYIYFAMAFSLAVEMLNLRAGSRQDEEE
jgi:predicted tellurium resistance membrane protein TerC